LANSTAVSPTPAPDGTVQASPFGILYNIIDGAEPSDLQVVVVADITTLHLEEFMIMLFADNFGVAVENFESEMIDYGTTPNFAIAYAAEITFAETSAFFPTAEDVDALIQLAFLEPEVFDLLNALRELPPDDPFAATETVEFFLLDDEIRVGTGRTSGNLSATQITLVAGALSILLVAVCFLLMRFRSKRIEARLSRLGAKPNRVHDIPILMPSHSYGYSIVSSHSENLMHFRDDTGSTASSGSVFGSFSVRSIPSETIRIHARQVSPSANALSETQSFVSRRRQSSDPFHSGELDIQPI